MTFNWTPFAVPGLLVLIFGLLLTLVVYRSRPDRVQNRRLALQLLMEALVVSTLGGAVWLLADERAVGLATLAANFLVWPKLWTYYSFLATLDTPLARPLNRPTWLNALLVATLIAALTVVIWPDWYGGEVGFWPAVGALHMAPGTAFVPIFWMWGIMWLVGLIFSISALRNAQTDIRKEQARAYLLAFGTRDISFILVVAFMTTVPPTAPYFHLGFMIFPLIWVVYFPLVSYGILKHQLFDIDLRLKTTLRRSTVLGAFAAAFFVGSELLEQVIPAHGVVLGTLSAAVVALALRPLHRVAERVADGLMPGVSSASQYVVERKYVVYRDAVEGAMQDGSVSERERAILARLQASLDIEPAAAERIEFEVNRILAPVAPA